MRKFLVLMFISTLTLWSCNKDVDFEKVTPEKKSFSEIEVQPNFDWKTTIEYEFSIKGYANNILKITSENGQKVYQSTMLKKDTNVLINISLPAYEKTVRLKYMGQDVIVDLNNKNINYTFN